jgi:hypothetical protein
MFIARGNRQLGRWSALLATYAFVLNALLATTLLAATAPAKSLSGFELCASADSGPAAAAHDDKATKRAAVHCQLCLQHATASALPPPSGVSLPLPLARTMAVATFCAERADRETRHCHHSPRGPPHLS